MRPDWADVLVASAVSVLTGALLALTLVQHGGITGYTYLTAEERIQAAAEDALWRAAHRADAERIGTVADPRAIYRP